MRISEHLSWAEATVTQQDRDPDIRLAQDNPPASVKLNLQRIAVDLFEPIRAEVGPLRVTSGYRCPKLNLLIGGSKTSAHMFGLALDLIPVRMSVTEAYKRIAKLDIPIDQLIWELGRWIHVGGSEHGKHPRGQRLAMFAPGRYEVFNENDPRIRGLEAV